MKNLMTVSLLLLKIINQKRLFFQAQPAQYPKHNVDALTAKNSIMWCVPNFISMKSKCKVYGILDINISMF